MCLKHNLQGYTAHEAFQKGVHRSKSSPPQVRWRLLWVGVVEVVVFIVGAAADITKFHEQYYFLTLSLSYFVSPPSSPPFSVSFLKTRLCRRSQDLDVQAQAAQYTLRLARLTHGTFPLQHGMFALHTRHPAVMVL